MTNPDRQALREKYRSMYGDEYTDFLLADSATPRLCPRCATDTMRKLWLGEPATKIGDSVWGKWYLWCESCLTGIYCPFGTHTVPAGESYIRWGDEEALKKALPQGLRLVRPETELRPR